MPQLYNFGSYVLYFWVNEEMPFGTFCKLRKLVVTFPRATSRLSVY